MALIEAEALEPRVQLAYSRRELSAEAAAGISLVRLLLERADKLTRSAVDVESVYDGLTYSDKDLAGHR